MEVGPEAERIHEKASIMEAAAFPPRPGPIFPARCKTKETMITSIGLTID